VERGVKGILPTCCFPLWGREGVTLIGSVKCKKNKWVATGFLQSISLMDGNGLLSEALFV
jgi:hypothetical protein